MTISPRNILVITYWSFNDALIQAYTLPYVEYILESQPEGAKVFLVTLEKNSGSASGKTSMGSPKVRKLKEKNVHVLPFRYFPFGFRMMLQWAVILFRLIRLIRVKKIRYIHAWCTPAGAAGYILSKLTGRPLIVDSFEPHAEPMLESGTWKEKSLAFRLLFRLEKKQAQRATAVIACVSKMKDYCKMKYGYVPSLFFHKPACVDLNRFDYSNVKNEGLPEIMGLKDKIVCVYAGKFGGSYLEKETFDFFRTAHFYWGDRFRVLLLTSHSDNEIRNYCEQSKLPENVVVKTFLPHEQVPSYMGLADFAITPFIPVPSKRYGSPIKTGEYFALGLPVVITKDISDDSLQVESFDAGYVLNALNEDEYKAAVIKIEELIKEEGLRSRIRKIAEQTRDFQIARKVYAELYKSIAEL